MFIPPQGFRHAVTLLLTNRMRAISAKGSADVTEDELETEFRTVVDELAALAADMQAPPEASEWLNDELARTIARIPTVSAGRAAIDYARARLHQSIRSPEQKRCDLFLIYVPEDRLPVAAPLAIALTKRRLTVAFSNYEVAEPAGLADAVATGLRHHTAGIILATKAFDRAGLRADPMAQPRIRVLHPADSWDADELVSWAVSLK